MRRIALIILMLATLGTASAQDPVVRVSVTPETVSVGESAQMQLTVLVPTWFAKPPVYPSFEVANAVTRLPPNSSYPTNERIDGESWSGIVRNYRVYPLMAADFQLGGEAIVVSVANPGAEPLVVEVPVPDIRVSAVVPEGAEGLSPYLAGRSLMLTRNTEGDLDNLEAGDAVVVTTVAELDGLPAMFIPTLSPDLTFDGVSVYADEPVVEDGEPARRTEKVTFIFQSGGEFLLPGLELDWWDTVSNGIATSTVPEIPISVTGPVPDPAPGEESVEPAWQELVVRVAGLIVVLLVGWRILSRLRVRATQVAAEHRATESYVFLQFSKACKSGDAKRAHHAMLAWLERINWQDGSQGFAQCYGDRKLLNVIDALSDHVYHSETRDIDLLDLLSGLKLARRAYRNQTSAVTQSNLPPLNP